MTGQEREKVWVVIAAFRERGVIADVVAGVARGGWSVVVVDDGSGDGTADAARAAGVVVLEHAINRGQGAALQTGIELALRRGAHAIVTFDADGQHDARDIPALVDALEGADIALGSRFLGAVEGASRSRLVLLRAAVLVSNRLSGMQLTDAHCGLRAFRASAAPALSITQDRMAHASELLRKIRRSGLRVVEVPVTVRYTEHSMRKGQGGLQAVRIMFDYLVRARMIIRIILLVGLAAVGWLVFLRRNRLPLHIMTVFLLLAAGAVAVVVPESTNDIAHVLGVGRGADLVTYVSIVAILFVLVHYYTKFVELQQQVTRLTRELAIDRAERERPRDPAAPT